MKRTAFAAIALALTGAVADPLVAAQATRRDDAYHFAQFVNDPHRSTYAEWWYFNLIDPASNLELAVTYTVIDPLNLSGLGLSSVAAIAYTQAGAFTEATASATTDFSASSEQADVLIANGFPPSFSFVQVLSDDVYHVVGAIDRDHDISWDLLYVRRRPSWLAGERMPVGIFPWESMGWIQYMPGASVWGTVVIDGRRYHVSDVRGYHDHNWGTWIPFTVTWNWAQYFEPGLAFSIGDFRNSATGLVSIDVDGERTTFTKGQYALIHQAWSYDAVHQRWLPGRTWLYASNQRRALIVRMQADRTVPVLPPPEFTLPLVPVIYEQTAEFIGSVWDADAGGTWRLTRAFRGTGFKEYTDVTVR